MAMLEHASGLAKEMEGQASGPEIKVFFPSISDIRSSLSPYTIVWTSRYLLKSSQKWHETFWIIL